MTIGLRAGWKRQTFELGIADAKTGPYFGINYYQRIQ
jgi:hypothetical protein